MLAEGTAPPHKRIKDLRGGIKAVTLQSGTKILLDRNGAITEVVVISDGEVLRVRHEL